MHYLKNNSELSYLIGILVIVSFVMLFFRTPISDETYYLRETVLLSELIKKGIWPGNYGVSLHGVLSKVPVAIFYIFTGPSVAVATISTYIFGILSLVLFYKILKEDLKMEKLAFFGTLLLVSSYHFVLNYFTYLREIPVLFTVLLLIHAIIRKKTPIVVGLIFLFMFDAKEHVYYSIALGYFIWFVITKLIASNWLRIKPLNTLKDMTTTLLFNFTPALAALILMMYTGLIPLNIYHAHIFLMTEEDIHADTLTGNFNPYSSTRNFMGINSRKIPTFYVDREDNSPKGLILKSVNIILLYFGKTLYPRNFGYTSIPLGIIVPSFFSSIFMFRRWLKEKEFQLSFLSVIFWTYLLVFMLMSGHGRYLFPIAPFVFIFYLYLTNEERMSFRFKISVLTITSIMVILSLLFEEGYLMIKIGLNIILLMGLFAILFPNIINQFLSPIWILIRIKYAQGIFILLLSICTFFPSIAVYFSLSLQGQIASTMVYGRNYNAEKIAQAIGEFPVLMNYTAGLEELIGFYINDTYMEQEWAWKLDPRIPKKYMGKTLGTQKIYTHLRYFSMPTYEDLKKNGVKNIVLISSDIPSSFFYSYRDVTGAQDEMLSYIKTLPVSIEPHVTKVNNIVITKYPIPYD